MVRIDLKEFLTDHCIFGFFLGCNAKGKRELRWDWAWPNGALLQGYHHYPSMDLPWHRCWRWQS